MTDAAALGRRVHTLRAARGFSLQEFALLAGLSAPLLSALERGEESTTLAVVFAAAEALELPVAALFEDAPAVQAVEPAHADAAEPAAPSTAPRGYVPLEVPDLWEPPAGTPDDQPAYLVEPPVVEQAPQTPQPVVTAAPAQPVAAAPPAQDPVAPAPRTFADLRVGPLAGRSFATLPEFAVAAIVEGGHPISVVASIFRVPSWRLEAWMQGGAQPPASAPRAPRF